MQTITIFMLYNWDSLDGVSNECLELYGGPSLKLPARN